MRIGTIAIGKHANKAPAVVNAPAFDDASIQLPQLVRQINRRAFGFIQTISRPARSRIQVAP